MGKYSMTCSLKSISATPIDARGNYRIPKESDGAATLLVMHRGAAACQAVACRKAANLRFF